MSLDRHLTILSFETLARTAKARLEGEEVVGQFDESLPLVITDTVRISEIFANCGETPTDILRFTRRYSPLQQIARPGDTFRFALDEWRKMHWLFRQKWKETTPQALPDPKTLGFADWTDVGTTALLHGKYRLEFFKRGIVFKAEQFDTLIDVCFASIPLDRRRVCPAHGCTTPYFVAHHLKQTFCGKDECIQWGQRKLKREYWERNKASLLAKRKRGRSGGNNVARKAR